MAGETVVKGNTSGREGTTMILMDGRNEGGGRRRLKGKGDEVNKEGEGERDNKGEGRNGIKGKKRSGGTK